jgi:hypothetical protein
MALPGRIDLAGREGKPSRTAASEAARSVPKALPGRIDLGNHKLQGRIQFNSSRHTYAFLTWQQQFSRT